MAWPFDLIRSRVYRRTSGDTVPLVLYNTLSGAIEEFRPLAPGSKVRMYNCGPTVYDRQHIGNLSMYVFTDVLRRTLEYNGFTVKQVINITDVGHLTSDQDEGDDKMMKGLKREGMKVSLENMRALGEKYASLFIDDLRALNIDTSRIEFPRASDHVRGQIAMIETLLEKGYAYQTPRSIYFDTSRFPRYGALGHIDLSGLQEGARIATVAEKRNPADFALWKFNKRIGFPSPWGKGFPGWHIECSAMIRACLGEQIDIHTGGIEHIAVHHNNEIAQSEAAIGKQPLARFWLHRAHIQFEGGKLAKSSGNVVYLSDVVERVFSPLALRYLFLGAHYRTSASFSWEALDASQTALTRLYRTVLHTPPPGEISSRYQRQFISRINDDLDTPGALAVVWNMLKDDSLSPADRYATLLDFDRVLGLRVPRPGEHMSDTLVPTPLDLSALPQELQVLVGERERARAEKDWGRADTLREQIRTLGYELEDSPDGLKVYKK